ncbi:ankyrin repeat and mynd domain protein 1 [Holotrichia oblita]|uniref:Ankyrin repeat and mynd domain protein 1 n=1 Tax=Holotrichia oblita TaxID=644536 RepID=A0ACB9SPA7_HOLOL|nr:ankyrin repeat and mynd domain protein 1 [Holotrichia oblita]
MEQEDPQPGTSNSAATTDIPELNVEHVLMEHSYHDSSVYQAGASASNSHYFPEGVRNNLLTKNIYFTTNNKEKVAKWQDIYIAWQLDCYSCDLRIMPKLTEHHVNRECIKKMKVSVCTQVFSHTVSSAINLMAKSEYQQDNIKMENRAAETAEFLKFFDNVFDSVNGYRLFNIHGKILRTGVDVLSAQTPQTEFWYNAVKVIESMYAKDHHNKRSVPPTFKNWVFTLKNFILYEMF